MKYGVLIFFVLVVLVSGCSVAGLGSNEGIRITSFSFDANNVNDKDIVELALEIENRGSYDSDDVNFYLYGYDTDSWESKAVDSTMGTASEDDWSIDDFKGYDGDTGFEGTSAGYYRSFSLADDRLLRGMSNTYNFNGRLCYNYQTNSNARITAISATERRQTGSTSSGSVQVINSYAPIQVEVKTKSPLVFYDGEDGVETELALILKNVGSGYAASDGCSVDVTVDSVNMLSSIEAKLDGESLDCDDDYSLNSGQAVVYCSYTASGARPKGEYLLTVTAEYYYYDDVKASITVTGTADDVDISGPSGGSGSSGTTVKLKSCEDACENNGVEGYKGLGMCVDSDQSIATYPGTSTDVNLKTLSVSINGPFYLEDQNMHDVTAADAGITSLSATRLSIPDYTKQFSEKSLSEETDAGDAKSTNLGLEGSGFVVTTSANPSEHDLKSNELVDGMRIVGIGDKTIAQLTSDSTNSKVKSIKYLDVEKMDLHELNVVSSSIAQKVKCKSSVDYTDDTVCKCVQESEDRYPAFDGVSNSACNTRCKGLSDDYAGGACTTSSSYTAKSGTRCKGSNLVQYDMHIEDTDDECSGTAKYCWCYEILQSLSSADKDLMCE